MSRTRLASALGFSAVLLSCGYWFPPFLGVLRADYVRRRGRYRLADDVDGAAARLPFPDPHLTLGEARQLAKGRGTAHRQLKEFLDTLLS